MSSRRTARCRAARLASANRSVVRRCEIFLERAQHVPGEVVQRTEQPFVAPGALGAGAHIAFARPRVQNAGLVGQVALLFFRYGAFVRFVDARQVVGVDRYFVGRVGDGVLLSQRVHRAHVLQ